MNKVTHFTSFRLKKPDNPLYNKDNSASSYQINRDKSILKMISYEKNKIQEKKQFKALNNNFYTQLEQKLSEQLKYMNNHSTPQVREKIILKERCRTQKHMRKNSMDTMVNLTANTGKKTMKGSKLAENRQKLNLLNSYSRKKNRNMHEKVNTIMDMCGKYQQKFSDLKEDIGVMIFYQKLVQRNSQKILKKIL